MMQRAGINVVGHVTANLGLGVVAREVIAGLQALGHPVAVFDQDPGLGRSGFDLRYRPLCVPELEALPHDITLWILGAESLEVQAAVMARLPALQRCFHVMYVWWELPHVSPVRALAATGFDALVAGSEFVQEAFRNAVGELPVLKAETPVSLPGELKANRSRFGLAPQAFAVLTGFEPASDPHRKNPWASISAFQLAFPMRQDVQLVVKLNNAGSEPRALAAVAELEALAAKDGRIVLIKDRLSHADLLSLYASCDVTLSLHRSEGLGLMPLEGMRLGRPTVCTGWSGNMTYMSHANSVPVRYRLVAVDDRSLYYSQRVAGVRSFWADPDVNHAASALRRLSEDRALLDALGARAKADTAAYHARALQMPFVDEIVALADRRSMRARPDWAAIASQVRALQIKLQWDAMSRTERIKARIQWRRQALAARLGWGAAG